MLDVLLKGAPDLPERLSFSDLGSKVQDLIYERFSDEAVRPQILSPDQGAGDVAGLPLFPNRRLDSKRLQDSLIAMEARLEVLLSHQESLQRDHVAMSRRLEEVAAQLASENVALPVPDGGRNAFGMNETQWSTLPGSVKAELFSFQSTRRAGLIWLGVCICIATALWITVIMSVTYQRSTPYTMFRPIFMVLCILLGSASAWPLIEARRRSRPVPARESGLWDSFDRVVQARLHHPIRILGLELDAKAASLSSLIYFCSAFGSLGLLLLSGFQLW
jgi:hypothetical protein